MCRFVCCDSFWHILGQCFFSLQPVRDTREKQVQLWKELILDYCRTQQIFVVGLEEDFPLFLNPVIESKSSFLTGLWLWSWISTKHLNLFREYLCSCIFAFCKLPSFIWCELDVRRQHIYLWGRNFVGGCFLNHSSFFRKNSSLVLLCEVVFNYFHLIPHISLEKLISAKKSERWLQISCGNLIVNRLQSVSQTEIIIVSLVFLMESQICL